MGQRRGNREKSSEPDTAGLECNSQESRPFSLGTQESLNSHEPDQSCILRLIWKLCVKGDGVQSRKKKSRLGNHEIGKSEFEL